MFILHTLPFWFLVFALFLPRIALLVAWVDGALNPFHLQGLLPLVVAVLLPRVLILYLIYIDQGLSLWFVVHLVVALMVGAGRADTTEGGGGGTTSRDGRCLPGELTPALG